MLGPFSRVFVFVPFSILLALSFFVLVVLTNVKLKILKVFGYLVVIVIWLTAFSIVFTATCNPPMNGSGRMMRMRRGPMGQGTMGQGKENLPERPMIPPYQDRQDIQVN